MAEQMSAKLLAILRLEKGFMAMADELDEGLISRAPETCLICGAHEPSHTAVREGNNLMAYRLCGKHTLREVILDGRFDVEISRSDEYDYEVPAHDR